MNRAALRALGRAALLALWFVGVVVLMATLALGHQFALAALDRQHPALTAGLARLLRHGAGGWAAVHVLYGRCRCSQRIAEHLRASQRPEDLRELVLLVGDEHDDVTGARLAERGFEVVPVAAEALATRFGIEGAPAFVLIDPARRVRYLGGYTARKQGPDIRDLAIVREARQGVRVLDLPVFGCAVSQRLQALFEPFAQRR